MTFSQKFGCNQTGDNKVPLSLSKVNHPWQCSWIHAPIHLHGKRFLIQTLSKNRDIQPLEHHLNLRMFPIPWRDSIPSIKSDVHQNLKIQAHPQELKEDKRNNQDLLNIPVAWHLERAAVMIA